MNRWAEQSSLNERSGIIILSESAACGVRTEVNGSKGIELGARQVSEKGSRSIAGDITTEHDNTIKTTSEPVMDTAYQAIETGTSDFATEQR